MQENKHAFLPNALSHPHPILKIYIVANVWNSKTEAGKRKLTVYTDGGEDEGEVTRASISLS